MQYVCTACGAECEVRPKMCPFCIGFGTFGPKVTRAEPGPSIDHFVTTAELVRQARHGKRVLPPDWEKLFGSWDGTPTSLLAHGEPGSGKSTTASVAAHRVFRSAVYLSGEEGVGSTVRDRLSRLELVSNEVHVSAGRDLGIALAKAEETRAELIIVDSIGVIPITHSDVAGVLSRGHSLWLIAHELKGQGYRGPGWVGHAVDIVVRMLGIVDNTVKLDIEKSRWGSLGICAVPL